MLEFELYQQHHTIVTRFLSLSFTLMVFLTGCMVTPPTQPTAPARETKEDVIGRLLDEASTAFEENRLTTPREHSAYNQYQRILALDPTNPTALLGINAIVEQYLSWSINQAERGNYQRARQYVRKARSIDNNHLNIPPVLKLIADKEKEVIIDFKIDSRDLANRRVSKMILRNIVRQIKPEQTFVTIRAPNDASGRWLYQELNRRADFRIEARFEASSQPSISLSK